MPVQKMKRATRKTATRKRVGRVRARVIKVAVSNQDSGEGSIDEAEEQEELMTFEQAELMEQYRNDFFSAILVIIQGSG